MTGELWDSLLWQKEKVKPSPSFTNWLPHHPVKDKKPTFINKKPIIPRNLFIGDKKFA